MGLLKRMVRAFPLLVLSPFLVAIGALALWLVDLFTRPGSALKGSGRGAGGGGAGLLAGSRPPAGSGGTQGWSEACTGPKGRPEARPPARRPAPHDIPTGASVVIPNWNGKDLLAQYLPTVVEAMAGNPANEVIVVDNGSTDGSADFVRAAFPQVKVLALPKNLGFGGGSNAGFREARNPVVLLLNSDMRVEPDMLAPLLEGFRDPDVFAVSCQIFFTDPAKRREETGLTQGSWLDGGLKVRHRIDPEIRDLYPCFYGGGGSCAFDREKFLELGGFDPLFEPFYLEDTDLSYMAWKRGWKVLYQPRSVVYHEHRGTIGKRFRQEHIQAVLKTNYLLFAWKNIHEPGRLAGHLLFAWVGTVLSVLFGDDTGRPNPAALWRAFRRLGRAMRSRRLARSLSLVTDTEAFRRPLGGYFRDRFADIEHVPRRLRVLFVSPYPICPPVHGGGVFMYQTLRAMARLAEVHVVEALDNGTQVSANLELREFCASAEWIVRPSGKAKGPGSILPYAVREFANDDLEWLIHRQLYLKEIDVLQLEYTPLAQYRGEYRRISQALFEHDVYFQSIARGLGHAVSAAGEAKARLEYLRALRYELDVLPCFDQVQVCTPANRDYLLSYRPELAPLLRAGLRAGIDTSRYACRTSGREPFTMLFLGSFRHDPNRVALDWFVGRVLPIVLKRQPCARLVVVGSDPPPAHTYADVSGALDMRGYVEDVRELLGRCAVFVCPILSGSGVRVKLLEAFAAGIPVVSTRVGAEGLAHKDGEFCRLSDDPEGFAERVLAAFEDEAASAAMAARARAEVERDWDMAAITVRLVASYAELVELRRGAAPAVTLSSFSGAGPS